MGLNILEEIKKRFNIPNGLSDHSGSPWPSIAAMRNHADFLEVHVNFDRAMYGPDSSSSLISLNYLWYVRQIKVRSKE